MQNSIGMRILVPLDDSMQAQRVLAYVRALAQRSNATINLIRATDVEDETSFNSLEQNAARLRDEGLAVEWSVFGGIDAETAIRMAEAQWKPDVIALASIKSSGLDRWLNGSVTEHVVKSASAPVLVVPPAWERSLVERQSVRILVPLDGSASAEQVVWVVVRLVGSFPTQMSVMRALPNRSGADEGAQQYLSDVAAKLQASLPAGHVTTHLVAATAVEAILNTARDLDVDAIALTTRGASRARHALIGRTALRVFDRATVPLILVGPAALVQRQRAEIRLGAQARSLNGERLGEVHRVVLDLDQRAVVSLVVLSGGALGRDVLVPVDYIQSLGTDNVKLGLSAAALDDLPDFVYNELDAPPDTWTSSAPLPGGPAPMAARQHKRLGAAQHDVTRRTQVLAADGPMGHVDGLEWDSETGSLSALVLRGSGFLGHEQWINAEWLQGMDEGGNLRLGRTRAEVQGYLGTSNRRSTR
jgi:nucleotide-binding universal stress UspA family protein